MTRANPRQTPPTPVTFSPRLAADDPLANFWLRQVTVRLRREIAWLWYERGEGAAAQEAGLLPPFSDIAQETLDLSRFAAEKQHFFEHDPTALYLSQQLSEKPPKAAPAAQGTFRWVVDHLGLDPLGAFLLALGASAALDHTLGSVIAACHNHPNKTQPTLALAQKLWDEPHALLAAADPAHPLFGHGLLQGFAAGGSAYNDSARQEDIGWETPLSMPPLVANELLFTQAALPPALAVVPPAPPDQDDLERTLHLVADRTAPAPQNDGRGAAALPAEGLRIIPVRGRRGAARREVVASIAALNGRPVVEFYAAYPLLGSTRYLDAVATLCWLRGVDLFVDEDLLAALSAEWEGSRSGGTGRYPARALPSPSLPILVYVGITDRAQLPALPARHWLPVVDVPEFGYAERLDFWRQGLGTWAQGLERELAEAARRFRFGKETLRAILAGLTARAAPPDGEALMAACRAEMDLELGELAQKVAPRFSTEKLILPPLEAGQFEEVAQAMRALTEVHYTWGTARAWNESGITALFAGPSGTGKTMAAEILASQLDLPMYRIDLSQVVNKYIGETEKNLKRLFDAADDSDMILFFDEADSLFGKRTEVKDAHDRYANIEINYLLERMERFKGMAILATNRKKDLDEAFLRRLRYIVDFPLPGGQQRLQIWQQVTPRGVDASGLDYEFLAAQFRLSGGSIRSVVFNACLQSAGQPDGSRRLGMETVLVAIKREYDKLNRTVSLENFGPYAELIRPFEHQEESA